MKTLLTKLLAKLMLFGGSRLFPILVYVKTPDGSGVTVVCFAATQGDLSTFTRNYVDYLDKK